METKTTKKKTNKKAPQKRNKWVRRLVRTFWLALVFGTLSVVGLVTLTSMGVLGEMPNVKDLESPDIYVASEIISMDGKILDRYEKEKRIPIEFADLPPHLVNALKAKEDVRFEEHSGIDFRRLASAITKLGKNGGGSTITQQLAKLLFTDVDNKNFINRLLQKIKENIIAVRLERLYTKEEILTMYLNKFNYLRGANGIQTAAKVYFSKDVKDLNLAESSVFVAMLQKPSGYNPISNPNDAVTGRDGVLKQMVKYNYISTAEARTIIGNPIEVNYQPIRNVGETFSAYYKYNLRKEIQGYLADYEKKTQKKYDLYKDGLKIHVTIDSRMQKYAEEAIREHLSSRMQPEYNRQTRGSSKFPYNARMSQEFYDKLIMKTVKRTGRYKGLKAQGKSEAEILKNFNTETRLDIFTWKEGIVDTLMTPMDSIKYHKSIVQAGFMAMEPNSGHIKAWVGGIDWNFFKYDHVKQGRRQVGSTFKPFVYATAISELGYTPCTQISNGTFTQGGWRVIGGGGTLPIRDALAHSKNPVAARLINATGVDRVINMCRDLGVTSPIERNQTIALGSGGITIWEMLGAYCTFANYGTYTKPEIIWRIEDPKGKVIKENNPEIREVMSPLIAYTMLDIMQGVTTYGTAKRMRGMGISGQVAGKTGTTNDNSDGWFMGITPKLAAGAWVGWEDRYSRLRGNAQGATMAMPIWVRFFKKVYADKELEYNPKDKFIEPQEVIDNGGYSCDLLLGVSGEDDGLLTADEAIYGIPEDEPVSSGGGSYKPRDTGVNENLNVKDTIQDMFDDMDDDKPSGGGSEPDTPSRSDNSNSATKPNTPKPTQEEIDANNAAIEIE